jgi:hypothetical protein
MNKGIKFLRCLQKKPKIPNLQLEVAQKKNLHQHLGNTSQTKENSDAQKKQFRFVIRG